jgi:hypothetical protein
MKLSEMKRHLLTNKRTPYYDALARKDAHHEAGHVVVGHALGWPAVQVSVIQAWLAPQLIHNPLLIRSRTERSRCIADLRVGMAMRAAGHVAGTIHQMEVERRGFASPQEKRAYCQWWEIRASIQVDCDFDHAHDPHNDSCRLAQNAALICLERGFKYYGQFECLPDLRTADRKSVVAEIVRAEKRAEGILKQHWQAVCDVANAVYRSKSGVLKGKRLQDILARHFAPQDA